jgi:hypothetical protein
VGISCGHPFDSYCQAIDFIFFEDAEHSSVAMPASLAAMARHAPCDSAEMLSLLNVVRLAWAA